MDRIAWLSLMSHITGMTWINPCVAVYSSFKFYVKFSAS